MKGRTIGILVFTAVLLMIFRPVQSQTIVNIEKLQADAKAGWFAGLTTDFELEKGNSEVLELDGQSIVGYEHRRHAVKLFSGVNFLSEGSNAVTARSFIQLRYNYIFNSRYRTFTFYQYQKNKELILNRRQLIGVGLRRTFSVPESPELHMGAGLMYENERRDPEKLFPSEPSDIQLIRMNTLVFFSTGIGSNSSLLNSTYYQPALTNFGDFRLLNEASLEVAVKEYLDLNVSFVWRYDNRPPRVLKKYDIHITSGFSLHL